MDRQGWWYAPAWARQGCAIFALLATFAPVCCCDDAAFAQEPLLPLPTHPDRQEIDPQKSLPVAAQPTRAQYAAPQMRTTPGLPRPGNPSRGLAPPGGAEPEPAEPGEPEAEEAAEEAVPPGLFDFLPHGNEALKGEYIWTGEFITKNRGGLNPARASSFRSNLDVVVTADTELLGWWNNGRFFIYGQDTHGPRLTENYVGDYQFYSNLDSAPKTDLTQISEYWYQHYFVDDLIWIKVGKQDANADFAFVDLGGDYINSSFGMIPTVPLPTFPNQGLGLSGFAQLTDEVLLAGGIYDGAPQGGQWGFNTLGRFGYFSIAQVTVKTQWGDQDQLPQTVRAGVWHHSGDWEEIVAVGLPRTFNQNYGTFASVDQLLWKEPGEEGDEQGLGAFLQFGWAPGNRNAVQEYYGGGLTYRGWLAGRDQDLIGLGVANVLFSPQQNSVGGETYETAIELFYKCLLSDYISVQPDLQFIANPGGLYRDALLFGVRVEMVL
jgi:porin